MSFADFLEMENINLLNLRLNVLLFGVLFGLIIGVIYYLIIFFRSLLDHKLYYQWHNF